VLPLDMGMPAVVMRSQVMQRTFTVDPFGCDQKIRDVVFVWSVLD